LHINYNLTNSGIRIPLHHPESLPTAVGRKGDEACIQPDRNVTLNRSCCHVVQYGMRTLSCSFGLETEQIAPTESLPILSPQAPSRWWQLNSIPEARRRWPVSAAAHRPLG
jgi:hypothetical protein